MNQEVREPLPWVRKRCQLIAGVLAYVACFGQPLCYSYELDRVSQFGITWVFDRRYPAGQFANGDYWIVGDPNVTVVLISPSSVELDGRTRNGSAVNPSPRTGVVQGYDSAMYGQYVQPEDYDANLNVARPNGRDLSTSNPLILQSHSSLVSTISFKEPGLRPQIKTSAILTILPAPAPAGSFRPPYSGGDKTIRFNIDQLDYSLLMNLKPVPGVPLLGSIEQYFKRPWIDHVPNWRSVYLHPQENMPAYGREMATEVGIGALMLHLDFTDQQKEVLLTRFVQLGIDLYGILQDGGRENWKNAGGHASGRKYPILFAGLLLGDPDLVNVGKKSGDYLYSEVYGPGNAPEDYIYFGEDDQTFYVSQADVDITHSPQWNPDYRDVQMIPYERGDIGLPEWGISHASEAESSNKFWDTAYRNVSSPCWGGMVLAAHIMGIKDLWNHDALFDYVDRYMQCAVERRQTDRFIERMWDSYRSEFGPPWTMAPTLIIDTANGSVARVPDRDAYTLGQMVTLRAIADPGYEFADWSGGLSGTENPVAILIHSNRSINANFSVSR